MTTQPLLMIYILTTLLITTITIEVLSRITRNAVIESNGRRVKTWLITLNNAWVITKRISFIPLLIECFQGYKRPIIHSQYIIYHDGKIEISSPNKPNRGMNNDVTSNLHLPQP